MAKAPKKFSTRLLKDTILEIHNLFFQVFVNAKMAMNKKNVLVCWLMLCKRLIKENIMEPNIAKIILDNSRQQKLAQQQKSGVEQIYLQIYEAIGVLLGTEIKIENESGDIPREVAEMAEILRLWMIRELNLLLVKLAGVYAQQKDRIVGVRVYNLSNFDPQNLLNKYQL